MKNNTSNKNSYIELIRFILCLIILVHHSGFVSADGTTFFPSGGLAADAFFMITGYFTIRHLEKQQNVGEPMAFSMKYTLKKMLRLLPFAATGVVIVYLYYIVKSPSDSTIMDYIINFQNLPFELTLLPMTGVINADLGVYRNAPLWFLSSMMIALPVIVYVAVRFKDVFKNYLVWFVPMFIQGYMVQTFGGACPWQQYSGFFYSGVLRALAGITMGGAIFYASAAVSRKLEDSKTVTRVLLTIVEIGLLLFSIYYFHRKLTGYDEVFTLYMIGVMLTLALSGVTYTSRIQGKIWEFLGKLTLPIYCMHWGIYQWVAAYAGGLGYVPCIGLTFVICAVLSIVMIVLVDRCNSQHNR